MKVCATCGLVRVGAGGRCDYCDDTRERAAPGGANPGTTDSFAVGMRCRFQCRACGHLSPLDSLAVGGSVTCARCGMEQAFDVSSWSAALAHAHNVGDLAGPSPEGRRSDDSVSIAEVNSMVDVGVKRASAEHRQEGLVQTAMGSLPRTLQVVASPGHPLCLRCKTPLQWTANAGSCQTRCPSCGESAKYALGSDGLALHEGLVAALAVAHRSDGAMAKVEVRAGGATSFSCSGCGAPLEITGDQRLVTCKFCHMAAILPPQAARGLNPERAPELWWLLFSGPSPLRKDLEQGKVHAREIEDPPTLLLRGGRRLAAMGAVLLWGGAALAVTGAVVILTHLVLK